MAVSEFPDIAPGAPAVPMINEPIDTSSDYEIALRLQAEENAANRPWPEPFIVTSRITIRPYHPSDAPVIARLANNKKIAANMTNRFPSPYTLADAENFCALALDTKNSGVHAWIITKSKHSEPIGGCGLYPGSDVLAQNAEVGYWIGEEYWGKGYATEACRALTDWAFRLEHGVKGNKLQRLGAEVFEGNPGSGTVLKKCGYSHDGTKRGIIYKWGEIKDMEIWGQTRKEWEKKTKRSSAIQDLRLIDMTEGMNIGTMHDAF